MRIGLFVPTFSRNYNKVSASIWIRVFQMVEFYEAEGCSVYINNPLLKYDVAIYYRGVDYKAINIIRYLKKISRLVLWDTCVNYFENNYANNQYQIDNARKISSIVDAIIVTTGPLYKVAKKYNNNVLQMPECINFNKFNKVKKRINFDNTIFGWSGASHKAYPLNAYGNSIDGNITLITDDNIYKHSLNFRYSHRKWNYKEFLNDILSTDVCLAPRNFDNEYDLMHSSFKILVFSVCGIPIITNKLPSYVELASYYDGIYFLEDYKNDFISTFDALKNDFIDNKNILSISRVKEEFSCEKSAERLLNYVRDELMSK